MAKFNLLTDLQLNSAHTVGASFADIAGMSDTVTIAGPGSVVILMMSLNPELQGDECGEYRFTHDGARVGPEVSSFSDATDEGSGRTLIFALTGLSAGSHTFAVQAANRSGTVVIDTAHPRTFQIVEIESGASILVDLETSVSNTAPASFANMTNLSGDATPTDGALLLFLHGSQILGESGQKVAQHRFAIDGARDGPEMTNVMDNVDETTGVTMAFGVTGVSAASHTFSIQWERSLAIAVMDTARPRTFQVVEIESDFDLLVDLESVSADSADAGYTDIDNMSGTPVIDSTDSIVLVLANYSIGPGVDETSDNRFSIGGTQEGAEVSVWTDAGDRGESLLMARAVTGESGSTAMSLQWKIRKATPDTDTNRERTFQVIDLKAVGVVTASGTPSITAIEAAGTALIRKQASGTPSIPAIVASGAATVRKIASGAAVLAAVVAVGTATVIKPASGAPSITPVASAGTALVRKQASGNPSITAIEASGTASVRRNASGAASITAIEASGAATVRKIASGAASIAAVESSGTATVTNTASGNPIVPAIEASGTAAIQRNASGTPSIPAIEAAGAATVRKLASGAATIAPVEAAGAATVAIQASGAATLTAIEASGAALVIKLASGAPSIPPIEAAGTAIVGVIEASGAPSITAIESAGTATVHKAASGAATLAAVEASGTAIVVNTASGAATTPPVEASGAATVVNTASGAATIAAVEASGAVDLTRNASGAPSIPAVQASGAATVVNTASGAAIVPAIEAAGTAEVQGVKVASGAATLTAIQAAGQAAVNPVAIDATIQITGRVITERIDGRRITQRIGGRLINPRIKGRV